MPHSSTIAAKVMAPAQATLINPMAHAVISGPENRFRTPERPNHNGIDIVPASLSGPLNDLLAVFHGTVIEVLTDCVVGDYGCGSGWGNYVKIHLDGPWSEFDALYAHCSSILVKPGDRVKTGQVIAIEGKTGASGVEHLHFELHHNGTQIDPEPHLTLTL
jgi:murein DD-endopeptidase MepM/ murein hydrolase activator NlpD